MGLYFLGDTHGEPIVSLSYKYNSYLRSLTEDDVIIQLGDFGVPFTEKDISGGCADYTFDWISSKPYKFIVVGGNHENYDYWESCPIVDIYGGKARQAVTKKKSYPIYFVDFPTIFDICGKHVLCIPKAESHDIWNLLDPKDSNFKRIKKRLERDNQWYRVIGKSWWPQEKMNVELFDNFITEHIDEHFDYICSHDAPGLINNWFNRGAGRYVSTEGERYLEVLRKTLNFTTWVHGHYHFEYRWDNMFDSRMVGLYYNVVSENDLKEMF